MKKTPIGLLLAACLLISAAAGADTCVVRLTVTSDLTFPRTPMDPSIDFPALIAQAKAGGVLDPNSIAIIDVATGQRVPCAVTEDFAYGDKGRVEWVITNPAHKEHDIRFKTVEKRPPLAPADYTPMIGVGDLLRYNAGEPRPVPMAYISGLVDLTGDGQRDLVGCWNYAYRPGWPWDGIICYPRVGDSVAFEFGDFTRIRYAEKEGATDLKYFSTIYMSSCFGDFNKDGLADLVYSPMRGDTLHLYLNSGDRDAGGMPIFLPGAEIKRPADAWNPIRAVDLDRDGALDLVACTLYGEGSKKVNRAHYIRNTNPEGWPFQPADPVDLGVQKGPCFFDVDEDGALDAVCFMDTGMSNTAKERVVWHRNQGGTPPKFGEPAVLEGIEPVFPASMAAVADGARRGLLILTHEFQYVQFHELLPGKADFARADIAQSKSAVMALSDQAWPCICDWDGDGAMDLLVGGGYGWPRIVINEGTNARPAYAEAQYILSEGKPIKIIRNEVLGEPYHWHNMGYSYPVYVDWDMDGLPDLMMPNETNRIFWFKNIGTRSKPVFGPRQQLLVEGYPDSAELRRLSADRALNSDDPTYPLEKERPFWWRTGAAFADWNGDGLMELATHDGAVRKLTLFTQFRDEKGALRLKKTGPMKMSDGRLIDDAIVARAAHWTECFRAVDWDGDGLLDLIYSCAGTEPSKGSIYLLRNVGSKTEPLFDNPRTFKCFGWPIKVTNHGPQAWAGDLDNDGKPDLLPCVEWSVYPFYTHAALELDERPAFELGPARKE